jgi:hypothetical protein
MKLIRFLLFVYGGLLVPSLLSCVTDFMSLQPRGQKSFPWAIAIAAVLLLVVLGGTLCELFRIRKSLDELLQKQPNLGPMATDHGHRTNDNP